MRRVDGFLELPERIFVHAELGDRAGERALVEQTDDDFLAVDGREERNTKIDFLAGDADAETSVLRKAALGDVEAREDFDARGDGELERLRRGAGLDEVAVHAVAELECFFKRFDVNVGRLFLERLHEDEVHDFDNGCVLALVREFVEVDVLALRRHVRDIVGVRGLAKHLVHRGAGAVHSAERFRDAALGRDHRHDFHLRALPQVVECEHVQRVGHRDEKLVSESADRRELVSARHVLRHEVEDFLGNANLGKIDRRRVEAAAHADDHVLLGDELFVRQKLEQTAALLFLDFERLVELVRKQQAVLDQNIRDAFAERFDAHAPPFESMRYASRSTRFKASGAAMCHCTL